MDKQATYKTQERGVALVMALLMVLVLGLLAATVMFTAQSQAWTGLNYRLTSQSRYAAEAGVQNTMNWLSTYTVPTTALLVRYDMTKNPVQCLSNCASGGVGKPVVLSSTSAVNNYPDSAVVTAYGTALSPSNASTALASVPNASYSTTATLLRMYQVNGVPWLGAAGGGGIVQTWQITSTGTVTGVRNATVQVTATYEQGTSPIFPYGLEALGTGCGAIYFGGGSTELTDSYNSSLGTYASQSHGTNGNMGTNGNVSLGSGSSVNGNVSISAPRTATMGACAAGSGSGVTNNTGSGTPITGTITQTPAIPTTLPWGCDPAAPPCYPPGTKITTAQNVSTSCTSVAGCTKGTPSCSTVACQTTTLYVDNSGSPSSANVYTMAPGPYGNLVMSNNDVFHFTAGTYTVNSLEFGGSNAQIVVDSGPVIFNLVGNCASGGCPVHTEPSSFMPTGLGWANPYTSVLWGAGDAGFNVCAPGVVANPGNGNPGQTTCGGAAKTPIAAIPTNFQIVYGGNLTLRVGGMPNAAVTYAPNATYFSPGGIVGYYGSIVVKNFADTSGAPFHYDDALKNSALQVGQFRPIGGFSWTKF
jgi:Tfp pilus assembly protein PilX